MTQRPASPKVTSRQASDALFSLKPYGAEGRSPAEGPLLPFYNDL
jgi:hypothetical protein